MHKKIGSIVNTNIKETSRQRTLPEIRNKTFHSIQEFIRKT